MAVGACARQAPLLTAARAAQERGEWAEALRGFNAAEDRYGAALAQARVPVETGAHLTGAADVAFTGDGRALALVNGGVRDALTGAALAHVDGPASLQREWLVRRSGSQVRVLSLEGATLLSLEAPADAKVAIADDGRGAAIYRDGLWLIAPGGARLQVFKGPPSGQLQLAGPLAAVRTGDGALQLWSMIDRKLVLRREGVGEVFSLSADARALAWQDAAGLHLAAVDGKEETLLDAAARATRVAWSRDGALLAACGDDLRIYDSAERRVAHRLVGASGPCALSDDGSAALAGGRLWSLPKPLAHPHRAAGLLGAGFARGELVTLGSEGKVATWELPSGEEHESAWVRAPHPCGSAALSLAAGRVAAGGAVWKSGRAGLEKVAEVESGRLAAVTLAGDTLVLSSWPSPLAAFDARTAAPRWKLDAFACTLSSNGAVLAAGGRDGWLALFDAQTGAPVRTLGALRGQIRALAFSPDGRALAAAADAPGFVVYSIEGTEKKTFSSRSPARALAFSRDGALVAAGGEDGEVSLWELQRTLRLGTLPTLRGPVSVVAFSPDGAWLVSGTAVFGGARLTPLPNR